MEYSKPDTGLVGYSDSVTPLSVKNLWTVPVVRYKGDKWGGILCQDRDGCARAGLSVLLVIQNIELLYIW